MTKVVFYKKLNPNHRKYMDGTTAANARRSLLQTPVPPQAGTICFADPLLNHMTKWHSTLCTASHC